MRWQIGRGSGNISDRRGLGPAAVGGGGVGAVVLALIGYFVFGDPDALSGLQGQGAPASQQQVPLGTPTDQAGRFVDQILGSTEDVWAAEFAEAGARYQPTVLELYDQATATRCGTGQAAMGPFYCPLDRKVYIDLTFFQELGSRFGAPGDFAQAYVIAHEVGHHVQTLTGTSEQVRRAQQAAGSQAEANRYSVALELQADCYAGVWARRSNEQRGWLDPGDIEEGLAAAAAVGDDTLQRRSGGRVVPDSFTHGSAEQRQRWFLTGWNTGDAGACDPFSAGRP